MKLQKLIFFNSHKSSNHMLLTSYSQPRHPLDSSHNADTAGGRLLANIYIMQMGKLTQQLINVEPVDSVALKVQTCTLINLFYSSSRNILIKLHAQQQTSCFVSILILTNGFFLPTVYWVKLQTIILFQTMTMTMTVVSPVERGW